MRRSRIKASVTVPARRKTTKDEKDEKPESLNLISKDAIVNEEKVEIAVACVEKSQKAPIETENLEKVEQEDEKEAPQPSSIPKTTSILVANDNDTLASGSGSNEPSSKQPEENITSKSEKADTAVEESLEQHKTISGNVPGTGNAKGSSGPENIPIAKVSQTRTSFMRPTPRLDGGGRIRRNSVQGSGASASESEDDCRRTTNVLTNRMRNDSASSTSGPKGTRDNSDASHAVVSRNAPMTSDGTSQPTTKSSAAALSARQKRKMNVSESARKLAEARREFLIKHQDKQPDRAKLTMYDLIYYNPTTNPIKKSDAQRNSSTGNAPVPARAEAEDEEEEDEGGAETGEAMPVPQVKVGPDGHLILDEQSLVIEHTGAKKNRQALARTEALVDDECNGSGFYKKRQKTKDWPKWETLKFYKALNTVGTDFLLMQSLFPHRTRQEMKIKFKKEEKTNRRFVEKALTFHQEFDIDLLKEDLATFEENDHVRSETSKDDKSASRRCRGPKRKKNKSRRTVALSIAETNEEIDEGETMVEETTSAKADLQCEESTTSKGEKKRRSKRSPTSNVRLGSESTCSSKESDSDTEIYQIRPTRSGRLPKVRKLQAPTINTLDNTFSDQEEENEETPEAAHIDEDMILSSHEDDEEETSQKSDCVNRKIPTIIPHTLENSVPDISQVEPGSLIIVSRESADQPGETVLQVYMASSDIDEATGDGKQSMKPIILTPELLNTVTSGIAKVAPINVNNN